VVGNWLGGQVIVGAGFWLVECVIKCQVGPYVTLGIWLDGQVIE